MGFTSTRTSAARICAAVDSKDEPTPNILLEHQGYTDEHAKTRANMQQDRSTLEH